MILPSVDLPYNGTSDVNTFSLLKVQLLWTEVRILFQLLGASRNYSNLASPLSSSQGASWKNFQEGEM